MTRTFCDGCDAEIIGPNDGNRLLAMLVRKNDGVLVPVIVTVGTGGHGPTSFCKSCILDAFCKVDRLREAARA